MIGRVRGVLVERIGPRRGVLLSRSGAFYEVWLRGAATARIGAEAEGVVLPRVVTWARRRVGAWPRAAVATAVAVGAAGAVLGALYLRPAALPVAPAGPGLPGEGVVGAEPAPGPVPGAAESIPRPSVRPTGFAHRLEAPKLSVSWQPSDWASLTLKEEAAWSSSSRSSALWMLRRPLTLRGGAAAGSHVPAGAGTPGSVGQAPAPDPGVADRQPASGSGQDAARREATWLPGAGRTAVSGAVGGQEEVAPSAPAGASGGSGGADAEGLQLAAPAAYRLQGRLLPAGP